MFAKLTITKTLPDASAQILNMHVLENGHVTCTDENKHVLGDTVALSNEQFSNFMYLIEQVQESTWDYLVGRKDLEILVERQNDAVSVYRANMIQAVLDYFLPIAQQPSLTSKLQTLLA